MLKDVPVAQWQAYLRTHMIDTHGAVPVRQLRQREFDFYGKTLRGQKEQKPRWKRVLGATEGNVGEALGQLYVSQVFPGRVQGARWRSWSTTCAPR